MKMVPLRRLSALGKMCIAAIASITGLIQVPAVKSAIVPLAANHPHMASIIGAITVIGALLANPQVQNILGIEETATSKEEKPDGTIVEQVSTKKTTIS